MSHFTMGEGSYYGEGLKVWRWFEGESVSVGNYCSIADRVELFCGGGHRTSLVSTWPFADRMRESHAGERFRSYKGSRPTAIGNDVWIASCAVIMPGLVIGDGAVIGPHAVVFRDVEPYEVVRGNPAEHVRYRFPRHFIDALLTIRWWDWPVETIRERVEDFYLPVDKFVEKYA